MPTNRRSRSAGRRHCRPPHSRPWTRSCVRLRGQASNVPAHLPAGSDVATMSLLGYDPAANFTGRAPLEAAAQGIELGPERLGDSLQSGHGSRPGHARLYRRPHFDRGSRGQLLDDAQQSLVTARGSSTPGVSYRNLLLYRGQQQPAPFTSETRTTPPHDLTDKRVVDDFPRGPGSDLLSDLMNRSDGSVCRPRRQRGPQRPASCRRPTSGCGDWERRLGCTVVLRRATASRGR